MPIGTTRSSPLCHLPGAIRCPSLAAWKVTVRSASTAAPAISPLEASTPEAMSQATTGAPQRLIAAIAAAAGSRGAPAKPVPKIASTTAPEPASQAPRSPGASSAQSSTASTSNPTPAGAGPRPGRRPRCSLAADDPHRSLRRERAPRPPPTPARRLHQLRGGEPQLLDRPGIDSASARGVIKGLSQDSINPQPSRDRAVRLKLLAMPAISFAVASSPEAPEPIARYSIFPGRAWLRRSLLRPPGSGRGEDRARQGRRRTADRGVTEGAEGFLVDGAVGEGLTGSGSRPASQRAGRRRSRSSRPGRRSTSGFGPRSGLRIEKPLVLPEISVIPGVPVERSSRPMLETVLVASLAFVGLEHHGAAEAAFARCLREDAEVADRGGDRFEVDAGFLEGPLELVGRDLAGDAVVVDLVDRFVEALAEVGGGEGGDRAGGERAEQLRGVAARRVVVAEVAGEVDLDLVGAGDQAGDRGRFLGVRSRRCRGTASLRGRSRRRTVRSGRRCRRRRRRGCCWGRRRRCRRSSLLRPAIRPWRRRPSA